MFQPGQESHKSMLDSQLLSMMNSFVAYLSTTIDRTISINHNKRLHATDCTKTGRGL